MRKKSRHTDLRGIELLEDRRTMAASPFAAFASFLTLAPTTTAASTTAVVSAPVTTTSAPVTTSTASSTTVSSTTASNSTTTEAPALAATTLAAAQGGTFNVTDYGVVAGNSAVQTAAIQRVFNLAAQSGPGATVSFAPGVYVTGQINVPGNIGNIVGAGATLKLQPMAGPWARILFVAGTTPGDRPLMTIDGLEFDLNKNNQGWKGEHDLEHQAAIFLAGRKATSSTDYTRLNVAIKNVYMHDGAGDGIYVHHNVNLAIIDVRAKDIFRGALTITGGGADVTATRFKTSGSVLATGLDVEPNSQSDVVNVRIVDSELMGKFDVALTPGSTFTGTNVKASGLYYLYNGGGTFRLDSSTLYVNSAYLIRLGGDSAFTNSTFILTRNGLNTSEAATIRGVSVAWDRDGYFYNNQSVVFDNVRFLTDATIRSIDKTTAITTDRDTIERRNWLTVKCSTIDGQFDQGIAFWGGNVRVENTLINSQVAYAPAWTTGFYYNAVFVGNRLGSRVTTYWSTSYDEPNNRVAHSTTTLTSAQNQFITIRSMNRLGTNRYTGSRTITGNFNPTVVQTPGLLGDVFVKSPTEKWVATRGDYVAATWTKVSSLQLQISF